jgi:hypothetical protein
MKWLRTLERKWIPNFRHNVVYKTVKLMLAGCVILPVLGISKLLQFLLSKVRWKRKNKPDIVFADILDGWTNMYINNSATEEIAAKRAKICAECPHAQYVSSQGVQALIVEGRLKYIKSLKCGECGCPLSAKVRSLDSYCPIGKW